MKVSKKFLIAFIMGLFIWNGAVLAYDDVPQNSPYFYAVEFLKRAEVISSRTAKFKPDLVITRAEFIKYLVKVNDREFKEKTTAKLPFEDTKNNGWYASYFEEAIKMGILSDREKNAYPFQKLTLPDALELVFHSRGIPIPKRWTGEIFYKDVKKNKKLAPLFMRALEMDLATPEKEDYFGMYRQVTRGEAASIIYKMELVTIAPVQLQKENDLREKMGDDLKLRKIQTTWDLIKKNYVHPEKADSKKMGDAALKAMLQTLDDPYSVYMDEVENASFSDDLDGEIEGIGAMVGFNEAKEITIITPLPDTPASKAGFKAGDVIKLVGGVDISGMNLEKAVSLIKGPKGTSVTIRIKRGEELRDITVVRDVIQIKSLESSVKGDGKVMLIRMTQFSQTLSREFAAVVKQIKEDPNIKGIVLDLRGNPGGLLDSALQILNYFIKPGAASVQIKYSGFKLTQYATGSAELSAYPVAVLINKGSASASEIVAGALKDYDLATIVGETSFGKGTVQELNYFTDNSSLKITVAEWLTPLGNSIQGNGVTPDIAVPGNGEGNDPQLERALQEVTTLINAR